MWERNIDWLPVACALAGDQTYNPGMCPDQELNLQSFILWDDAPSNWATLARAETWFLMLKKAKIKDRHFYIIFYRTQKMIK